MTSDVQVFKGKEVSVAFNKQNLKMTVLQPLAYSLPNTLKNPETNATILKLIETKGILDPPELSPLTGDVGKNLTEFRRMSGFFEIFQNREDEEITTLFTILCNLEAELEHASLAIRKILVKEFPGCLRPKLETLQPSQSTTSVVRQRQSDQSDGPPRNTVNPQPVVDIKADPSKVKWNIKYKFPYSLTLEALNVPLLELLKNYFIPSMVLAFIISLIICFKYTT